MKKTFWIVFVVAVMFAFIAAVCYTVISGDENTVELVDSTEVEDTTVADTTFFIGEV